MEKGKIKIKIMTILYRTASFQSLIDTAINTLPATMLVKIPTPHSPCQD